MFQYKEAHYCIYEVLGENLRQQQWYSMHVCGPVTQPRAPPPPCRPRPPPGENTTSPEDIYMVGETVQISQGFQGSKTSSCGRCSTLASRAAILPQTTSSTLAGRKRAAAPLTGRARGNRGCLCGEGERESLSACRRHSTLSPTFQPLYKTRRRDTLK